MLLVQEHLEGRNAFTLFLSASDQVIRGNSEHDSFEKFKIPEPPMPENAGIERNQIVKKENPNIIGIEISKDNHYVAVTTENKQLLVFDKNFHIVKNIVLARVSSKVCFSPSNDILVADRTGDVYLYKILDEKNLPLLLLGHLSIILDMVVTECAKYIITCDRDEKIRVSHYPNAYNIATYCLGHTEFVTCLKLLKCPNVLLSASGDGTIRVWNYSEGKQLTVINTNNWVDKKALEKFANQMDTEKVDVAALPVTNIQVHEGISQIILAFSLYKVEKLYLCNINPTTLEYSLRTSIDVDTKIFSYCLLNRLYILSNKLNIYEFIDSEPIIVSYGDFEHKLLEYKNFFANEGLDCTLLYKRKYDNVQEYLERKKLRLDSK